MSYQPEERYWTDYLRIALPVVGLLLMLGLFWFWAASLIGDEDDDNPNNLANVATETPVASPSPSPSPTTETAGDQTGDETAPAGDDSEETPDSDEEGNPTDGEDPDAADDETSGDNGNGEEAPACDPGDFCEGVIAIVTSDNVNVRSDPVLDDANIRGQFSEGDEVVVTSEPEESEDLTWVQVEGTNADDEELVGYVTTQYLEPE